MTATALMNTYKRLDISFESGSGAYLTDQNGKRYLDALAGIGVCALGHAHPAVTKAITEQAGKLIHTSNIYRIGVQEQLAAALTQVAGMEKVFFSNSGAEANEAAIKLARLYGNQRNIDTPTIIVLEHAFHGRTMATLTASGTRKVQAGFEPLLAGFVRAPYDDIEAIKTIAQKRKQIVAILFEAVQGEGGLYTCSDQYMQEVRRICNEKGWLMMMDEVQTGNGRTGKYFAYQHAKILPDVVTTAKGLGNGVPIGACLVSGKATELFKPGNHGSTFGGNPLACAAALSVVNTIASENLCEHAAALGKRMHDSLATQLSDCRDVVEIRGRGLMIGIELKSPCGVLVEKALEKGLLINVTSENVVRLLPPLIITEQQADQIVSTVVELIRDFTAH